MLKLQERIELFQELGNFIKNGGNDLLAAAIRQSYYQNRWFTEENTWKSLRAIANTMLDKEKLSAWAAQYKIPALEVNPKTIGLIMAGNIPLVGFHDWLCVVLSGHYARVKLSDKDKTLLPFLLKIMAEWNPAIQNTTHFLVEDERLSGFDAVIATGSNNSARYFEQYFSKYPNIIRRNRTSIGILTGKESQEELEGLSEDLLAYFGLGCRNVSKIYVPENYDFMPLLLTLHEHKSLIMHDKYKNNYDYTLTLYLLNKIDHHTSGNLLLREDDVLFARISSAHFSYYKDIEALNGELLLLTDDFQCVVTQKDVNLTGLPVFEFGEAQKPSLTDYADGVDTMAFLTSFVTG